MATTREEMLKKIGDELKRLARNTSATIDARLIEEWSWYRQPIQTNSAQNLAGRPYRYVGPIRVYENLVLKDRWWIEEIE